MNFTLIVVFSFIATVILFSSGISIFNANHLEFIKGVGTRNRYFKWISQSLLSIIVLTSRIRRAWIRMISPGSDGIKR